eukprot:7059745-Prymnesium_polylepis.1
MVASRNGREGLELNASQDGHGGRVLTPARLEMRRGRLKMSKITPPSSPVRYGTVRLPPLLARRSEHRAMPCTPPQNVNPFPAAGD